MSAVCQVRGDRQADGGNDLPRVVFLARSLRQGGAERQLVALATGLHRRGWPVTVVCFYGGGIFQAELESAGVPLIDLRKRGRWDVVSFLWRLLRTFRDTKPVIVHGYMPVANLLSLLARAAHPRTRVIWGVRSTLIDREDRDWLSRFTFNMTRRAARFADGIIANSEAGATYHVSLGYPGPRTRIVANGIDTQRFRFDAAGRARVREAWGVPDGCVLAGLVGRVDPMKDHATFLEAAALLAGRDACWRFVCVGGGEPAYVQAMQSQAARLGLDGRLIWAGPRNDMAAVYSALDIAVSSSWGEGFPNVIAEAMACERPCVVTDVGDSARIVGGCGAVVEARDPVALSAAIERVRTALATSTAAAGLGAMARNRIVKTYSVESLLRNSEQVFRELCAKPKRIRRRWT